MIPYPPSVPIRTVFFTVPVVRGGVSTSFPAAALSKKYVCPGVGVPHQESPRLTSPPYTTVKDSLFLVSTTPTTSALTEESACALT